jgi:hypothetical protein
MARFARCLWIAPLLLTGCDISLTSFVVPLQAQPGSYVSVAISAHISGGGIDSTGGAGCVLQVPNGWVVYRANSPSWPLNQGEPSLLARYTAEPGNQLLALSSWDYTYGNATITDLTATVIFGVPATASGQYALKLSLAGSPSAGVWQIQEPAGVSQFAAITASPYVRTITVSGPPVSTDFIPDANGLPTNGRWLGAAFGDIDGDGRDDLAGLSLNGVACWLSRPGTTWIPCSVGLPASVVTNAQFGHMVAFGHFDGDGFLDLVDGNHRVFFGNGGTSWTASTLPPPPPFAGVNAHIAVGDVNGDGFDDVAIGHWGSTVLRVLLSNGDRTFRDSSTGLPQTGFSDTTGSVTLADLDGDGNLDLLWAHTSTPNLWLGDGQGHWTPGSGIPDRLTSAAIGDLDGDGVPEILVGRTTNTGLSCFKYSSGTTWVPFATTLPSSGNYQGVALLDFDRVGRLSVVAAHVTTHQNGIECWRNNGPTFSQVSNSGLAPLDGDFLDIAVGDFDGNTFPDFAIAGSFGGFNSGLGVTVWQNHRTGAAPFGTGCGGSGFTAPQLAAIGLPQRGNGAFAMQVQSPTPGALAVFWFGGSKTSAPPFALPLDLAAFGAPRCTLLAAPDYTYFGLVDGSGNYTVSLPVPTDPLLAFQTAFAQGAVHAPAANAFGAVFTPAMALRIQ